jgi:hypothetical protein
MNAPVQYAAPRIPGIIATSDEHCRSRHTGDKAMNTRIAFAAAALAIALVSGIQFAPAIAESLTQVTTDVATVDHAAPMTAAQKTRCMMPAAHWKGCGA